MTVKHLKQAIVGVLAAMTIAWMATSSGYSQEVQASATATPYDWLSEYAGSQDKSAAPQEKPAEEIYKNIQIFKGLPSPGVMRAMSFFTRSLGVDCTHCHVPNEFDKDDKPAKQTARKMYAMVQLSNKHLGIARVSCFMCHRGHAQPEPPPESWKAEMDEMRKQGEQDQRPAEQVYKNIQTLRGVPAGRWNLIMMMFTKALGVDCAHCHVPGAFEKDDKPAKQTARKMLGLTGAISREIYKGPTSINCYTCHRGAIEPVSFPPAVAAPKAEAAADLKPPELISTGPMPSVDQVLDKYVAACGGNAVFAKLTSRALKGSMIAQGGLNAPLEVFTKKPNKMLMIMNLPDGSTTIGFNGTVAWQKNKNGLREMSGPEAEFAGGQATSFGGVELKSLYSKVEIKGRAMLASREVFVIDGTRPSGGVERLYFDSMSGLLVRQDLTMEGAQGKTTLVLEFEDYREIDGVKLPFIRRWSRPDFTFTQKIDEIKHNVAIEDARFEKPVK
ncbi:MAG TPA: photosynthetic reaction center cytochrome c subunit family protein [Blastocatellia bacterium]|nr:photosynthetic reaction center cytochrome c subunit family protein [Blastocatellia bacterium]